MADSLLLDAWAAQVWSQVSSEFEALKQKQPPTQTEGAIGQAYSADKVLTALKGQRQELRNVAGCIAWVKPLAESIEGDALSMELIQYPA